LDDTTRAEIDIESLAQDPTFPGEVVRLTTGLLDDPVALAALIDELAGPAKEKLAGYEPGVRPDLLVERARDRLLDLLLAEGEGR